MEVKIRENGTERWVDVEALTVWTVPLSKHVQAVADLSNTVKDLQDQMTKRENRLLKAWEKMR